MDNEHEAIEFINNEVKNTTAFLMEMTEDDEEQDCTILSGSNSMFELRYNNSKMK